MILFLLRVLISLDGHWSWQPFHFGSVSLQSSPVYKIRFAISSLCILGKACLSCFFCLPLGKKIPFKTKWWGTCVKRIRERNGGKREYIHYYFYHKNKISFFFFLQLLQTIIFFAGKKIVLTNLAKNKGIGVWPVYRMYKKVHYKLPICLYDTIWCTGQEIYIIAASTILYSTFRVEKREL